MLDWLHPHIQFLRRHSKTRMARNNEVPVLSVTCDAIRFQTSNKLQVKVMKQTLRLKLTGLRVPSVVINAKGRAVSWGWFVCFLYNCTASN